MSRTFSHIATDLSLDVARDVDRICTAFEREYRNDASPRLEDWSSRVAPEGREGLLWQLLLIDLEQRLARGETPEFEEYRTRFPDDQRLVKAACLQFVAPARIGRFRVERLLGKGGFGAVYLAVDEALDRQIAIKMLTLHPSRPAQEKLRLEREAQLAAQLNHPAIVRVHEIGHDDDEDCFVVYEYINGSGLDQEIADNRPSQKRCVQIMADVADAVQHAHEHGVTHRDLKPANILIDAAGDPHVADFGLAMHESLQRLHEGEVAGTPNYMAPEQVSGETHRIDGRTDIWALGVILYEMLTGTRPFQGKGVEDVFYNVRNLDPRPPRQRNGAIDGALERIVLKCLAKRMCDRYSAAASLTDELKNVLIGTTERGASTATGVVSQDNTPQQLTTNDPPTEGSLTPSVVPKGLRCFDAEDAEFFTAMLPGPRDRHDLPDSIRFWQRWVDRQETDGVSAIGLIYGPSGCGKSSFVRAGLVPHLRDAITPLFVEATPQDTEVRLLKSIRSRFPGVPRDLSLPEVLAAIREGAFGTSENRVVIFVDQFEQWLHSQTSYSESQLVAALRQCDGDRLKTILMVRDDFWMQITRLVRMLEVPLVEGENSAAVDRFDLDHARFVLKLLGRAYRRLPDDPDAVSSAHENFLQQAVDGLAEGGRVAPVRLSLFAEMMKSHEWIPQSLRDIGGTEGTGVAFLESTFGDRTGAPEHRRHATAARRILESLLPDEGVDIRGAMRSEEELVEHSEHGHDRHELQRTLEILDRELRLITPTDPAGQFDFDTGEAGDMSGRRYFQLTHDYLVPSVRRWLDRERQTTFRGRLESRLAERARIWNASPQARHLPSWWEWVSSYTLSSAARKKSTMRSMLRAANRHFAIRTGIVFAVVAVLALLSYETIGRLRSTEIVSALLTAQIDDVPSVAARLEPYQRWANPALQAALEGEGMDAERLTRARLGLLSSDASVVPQVIEDLVRCEPGDFRTICSMLRRHAPGDLDSRLADVIAGEAVPESVKLRAILARTQFGEAEREQIQPFSGFVVNQVVSDVSLNARNYGPWSNALRPVRSNYLADLGDIFRDQERDRQQRRVAAELLVDLYPDDREMLEELLLDAEPFQFRRVFDAVAPFRSGTEQRLKAELSEDLSVPLDPNSIPRAEWRDRQEQKDQQAKRQANAILALYEWGDHESTWEYWALESGPDKYVDPRLQSYLIDRFGTVVRDAAPAVAQIVNETNASITRGLILAVGRIDYENWPDRTQERLTQHYNHHPDAGVHAAAEWALRDLPDVIAVDERGGNHHVEQIVDSVCNWYVTNTHRHTMVTPKFGDGTIRTLMLDPDSDADDDERKEYRTRLSYRFAISSKEVTHEQFLAFDPDFRFGIEDEDRAKSTRPITGVSWYDAARYCNWLSRQEGLEDERCYEEDDDGNVVDDVSGYYKRKGFRLPNEQEWEYACRAWTVTSRYFGNAPDLLDRYGWTLTSAGGETQPVGQLIPNRFGLFDMLGNAMEWCQNQSHPKDEPGRRFIRGGSFKDAASYVRSSNRNSADGRRNSRNFGFRIVQTIE